jgi:hypothetical protein
VSPDLLSAILSAVATLLATLLGGFVAYRATLGTSNAERKQRRAAIASGVLFELDLNRTSLYGFVNTRGEEILVVDNAMHNLFLQEIALFSPATVNAILVARITLDNVAAFASRARHVKGDVKDRVDSLTDALGGAELCFPLLELAEKALVKDGAHPLKVPSALGTDIEAAGAASSAKVRAGIPSFYPPRSKDTTAPRDG